MLAVASKCTYALHRSLYCERNRRYEQEQEEVDDQHHHVVGYLGVRNMRYVLPDIRSRGIRNDRGIPPCRVGSDWRIYRTPHHGNLLSHLHCWGNQIGHDPFPLDEVK